MAAKHVVFVHAHPDDEAIWTGGLIAALVQAGVRVTVVTCTLGELGEIIGEPYAGLVADCADQLGGYRITELRDSLRALGANGPSFEPLLLGGAGTWRDSGMIGDKGNDDPRAFIHSGQKATDQLIELLSQLQPDLVITYDADGGYGHPDHIRAHEISVAACGAGQLNVPTLWAVTDRRAMSRGLEAISVVPKQWQRCSVEDFAHTEGQLETPLSDTAVAAKIEAMRAHATQVWIGDGTLNRVNPNAAYGAVDESGNARITWAFSNLLCQPVTPAEHYRFGTAEQADLQWLFDARLLVDVASSGANEGSVDKRMSEDEEVHGRG